MITAKGYSKDPSIIPEGIMLTLPVQFFEERGMSTDQFRQFFEDCMGDENAVWNYRLTNLPKHDVAYVYLIFDKHVQYRGQLVMYERGKSKRFNDTPDGKVRYFPNANWVIFTGPIVKPSHEWPQKGFQGFRYTTKLF